MIHALSTNNNVSIKHEKMADILQSKVLTKTVHELQTFVIYQMTENRSSM